MDGKKDFMNLFQKNLQTDCKFCMSKFKSSVQLIINNQTKRSSLPM